jgi:hypothetical protein
MGSTKVDDGTLLVAGEAGSYNGQVPKVPCDSSMILSNGLRSLVIP